MQTSWNFYTPPTQRFPTFTMGSPNGALARTGTLVRSAAKLSRADSGLDAFVRLAYSFFCIGGRMFAPSVHGIFFVVTLFYFFVAVPCVVCGITLCLSSRLAGFCWCRRECPCICFEAGDQPDSPKPSFVGISSVRERLFVCRVCCVRVCVSKDSEAVNSARSMIGLLFCLSCTSSQWTGFALVGVWCQRAAAAAACSR